MGDNASVHRTGMRNGTPNELARYSLRRIPGQARAHQLARNNRADGGAGT